MATNVKYYCMGFLADGTPSVRTFASTKSIENKNEDERDKYIIELKNKVKNMTDDTLEAIEIILAADYDLYVNGDGTNTYVRDMETGTPKSVCSARANERRITSTSFSKFRKRI